MSNFYITDADRYITSTHTSTSADVDLNQVVDLTSYDQDVAISSTTNSTTLTNSTGVFVNVPHSFIDDKLDLINKIKELEERVKSLEDSYMELVLLGKDDKSV